MKRSLVLFAAIIAAIFLIGACSSDSTTAATTTTPTGDNIAGSYTRACISESPTFSFGASIIISGSTLDFTSPVYITVADCSGNPDYTFTGTVSLAFIGTKTMSTGETASTVDVTDTVDTLTPNTAAGADDRNAASDHGFTDWAVGVSKDILGLNDDGTPGPLTTKGIIYFNSAVTPNTFQFGLELSDGGTFDANGYPNELDTGVFVKQ